MAHPDLNALMSAMRPLAEQMLSAHGEFLPYGAFMGKDGKIVDCSGFTEDERPRSLEVIKILTSDFKHRARKREIRAAGLCFDVKVSHPGQTEKIDAVQFALEHQDGEALDVFLPYDLDSAGEVRFGQLFATARDREIFGK